MHFFTLAWKSGKSWARSSRSSCSSLIKSQYVPALTDALRVWSPVIKEFSPKKLLSESWTIWISFAGLSGLFLTISTYPKATKIRRKWILGLDTIVSYRPLKSMYISAPDKCNKKNYKYGKDLYILPNSLAFPWLVRTQFLFLLPSPHSHFLNPLTPFPPHSSIFFTSQSDVCSARKYYLFPPRSQWIRQVAL